VSQPPAERHEEGKIVDPATRRRRHSQSRVLTATLTLAAALLAAASAVALAPKEALDQLDLLVFVDPSLRVVEVTADAGSLGEAPPGFQAMESFRATHGDAWRFTVDLRRGVTSLLDGGAIPFIPGRANELAWDDFAPGCASYDCLPVATVEALARGFVDANSEALGFRSSDLRLDPAGSGPFGNSLYFLRFDWTVAGIPVDRASVFFRVNSGNLIQVATEHVGTSVLDPQPTLSAAAAFAVVADYLGPFANADDHRLDEGTLLVVPVTPDGQDPDDFRGPVGSGMGYRLA
jgi:hypothetical protein